MGLSAEGQAGDKDWGIRGVWVAMAVMGVDEISKKKAQSKKGEGLRTECWGPD